MGQSLQVAEATAISPAVQSGSELQITDQTDSDWFSRMVGPLLPKDAGLHLHYITGFEERTCYRYVSGDRKPPAYFLRAILRSEQGGPFLEALMHDCTAEWWIEFQKHHRMGLAAERARQPCGTSG